MILQPQKIIVLEKVDSTNNYAMAMVRNGDAIDGNAVFAMEQTGGKGRRGKHWKSNKEENIILSIIAEMQWLPVSRQFELIAAVALATHELVSKYIANPVYIKWPNDIFINDSKAGGILIETVIKGTLWQWAIIGIGININQMNFEEFDHTPVSFKKITGKNYNVLELAEELRMLVLARINQLRQGEFNTMMEEYNEKLFAKNRMVKLKTKEHSFQTTITAVSSSGQLITRDTTERFFNFDEVEKQEFL